MPIRIEINDLYPDENLHLKQRIIDGLPDWAKVIFFGQIDQFTFFVIYKITRECQREYDGLILMMGAAGVSLVEVEIYSTYDIGGDVYVSTPMGSFFFPSAMNYYAGSKEPTHNEAVIRLFDDYT